MTTRLTAPLLLAFLAAVPGQVAPEARRGLVVLAVRPDHAAAKAGLRVGDVLLGWRRPANPPANPSPAEGSFEVPGDIEEIYTEEAPRGPVTLVGRRQDVPLEVTLPPGRWGLEGRPELTGDDLESFLAGRRALATADGASAITGLLEWRRLADRWRDTDPGRAFWLYVAIGTEATNHRTWEPGVAALAEARRLAESFARPWWEAQAATEVGLLKEKASEFPAAREAFGRALESRRRTGGEDLRTARSLQDVSRVAWWQDRLDEAEAIGREALALRQRIAPDSMAVAESYNNLGLVAWNRGDLDAAEQHHRQALAIRLRLAPEGLDTAYSLTNLGIVAWRRGSLDEAETSYRMALALYERLRPESGEVGRALANLGIVLHDRGRLAEAEELYLRAAQLFDKHLNRRDQAHSLGHLGDLAVSRGDRKTAEVFLRQALAIKDDLGLRADSVPTLQSLARAVEDVDERARLLERARAILEAEAPDSAALSEVLAALGSLAQERGRLAEAKRLFEASLAQAERISPTGLDLADAVERLGLLAAEQGQLEVAEAHLRRALALYRSTVPLSQDEAMARFSLGRVVRRRGRLDETREMLSAAAGAIESQFGLLGGSPETRARLRASFADLHFELIDLLLTMKRPEEAFQVLERSRAREFLDLLARRDLALPDLPPEIDRRRRRAEARYRHLMADLHDATAVKQPAMREELVALRRELGEIEQTVRAASPRLAQLRRPPALDVATARRSMEPGTLMLAFAVGEARSYLFTLGPDAGDGLRVATLPAGRTVLAQRVKALREAVSRPSRLRTWMVPAEALSRLLLAPAAERMRRADRILLVPDAPLHFLPFAVLPMPGPNRPLGEVRPLTFAPSASAFAELASRPTAARPRRIAVFADPVYRAEGASPGRPGQGTVLAPAGTREPALTPLAGSRQEALQLGQLFPGTSSLWLGRDATEERVRQAGPEATHLHLACHAFADTRSPLDSSLVLSTPEEPGGEDGRLEAWEVFEQLRLDADLVTLSACDTALGEELAGEGILGLVRAFQFAGARAVLATQWRVSDEATPRLVERFYHGLRSGLPGAEALRRAQVAVRRDARTAHPYYWAAFQLHGAN